MEIKIAQLEIPQNKRLICISDVHGEMELLIKLLDRVEFCSDDILVLLGDVYLKGSRCHACLKYVMELSAQPNVHVLRGNCDWLGEDYLDEDDKAWLEALPHIIESEDFIFVHAGIKSMNLQEQDPLFCMRNDAFLENYDGPAFEKWVMVGHWPNSNYCHEVGCNGPIINEEKRIIAIDGGNVVKEGGQLNAFILEDDEFWWDSVDKFYTAFVGQAQEGSCGTLNITWTDRFIEIIEAGEEFSVVRHVASGKALYVPTNKIWQDSDGNNCIGAMATDHWLKVYEGDIISVIEVFSDRMFVKRDGIMGWVWPDDIM
ncbi:MAG: metallophosphoesterase [Defluviitaleaceae bacterium]|nr:metallophosphoesterase [Defluviitaleaceae bacterium]